MARLPHKPERSKAEKRQNGSNNETACPRKQTGSGNCWRETPSGNGQPKWMTISKTLKTKLTEHRVWRISTRRRTTTWPQMHVILVWETLWQKEGEMFRPIAFASRFSTDCEKKCAINEVELTGALWGFKHFRYYAYGKRVILLMVHQALQPMLKRNWAHEQYSASLTHWLDRLSHFDVNVQNTAGENIPQTDYLSRHPITHSVESEVNIKTDRHGSRGRVCHKSDKRLIWF